MHVNFGPRGILQIDNATLIFKNFAGKGDKYNREGDRNFAILIDDEEIANALVAEGWNVKIKPAREEGGDPFMYLSVKVKFNDRGPKVHLKTGKVTNRLDEETISILDKVYILNADLDVRPYDWVIQEGTPNEKRGRAAYLQAMHVEQEDDRFSSRYAEEEYPGERPFDDEDCPFN